MNYQNAILLVEDDALRRPIARRLRRAGYEVLDACSGPDALATLEAVPRPVDLLVTDLIMPRMSGRDLAQRLRERFPALRVLLVDLVVRRRVGGAARGRRGARGACPAWRG
jgi:CheY-like chemotaxis protein